MRPDFSKYADGLVPAIIQDAISNKVGCVKSLWAVFLISNLDF